MLSEKDMEDQIASHPERFLGEPKLAVVARQFRIGGYIFDLLFEDRHGGKLIVEIQKGTLDRNHTYKILDYYDEYRENNPHEFIDVMVVANQITSERKKRLHSLGVAFREIPEQLFDPVMDEKPDGPKSSDKEIYSLPTTTSMLSPDDLVNRLIELGYVARQNQAAESLFVNLGGPQSPINKDIETFRGLILLNPKREIAFGTCNIEEILYFRDLLMVNKGNGWERRAGVPGNGKRVTLDFTLEEKQTSEKQRIICRTDNGGINLSGYLGQLPLHEGLYNWEEVREFQNQLALNTQKIQPAQELSQSIVYKEKIYGSPLKDVLDAIIKQAIVDTGTQQMSTGLGENLKEYLLGKETSAGHRFLSQLEERLKDWRNHTSSKDKEKYIIRKLIYRIDNHLSRIFAELLETD